jgi:hypothetical protein
MLPYPFTRRRRRRAADAVAQRRSSLDDLAAGERVAVRALIRLDRVETGKLRQSVVLRRGEPLGFALVPKILVEEELTQGALLMLGHVPQRWLLPDCLPSQCSRLPQPDRKAMPECRPLARRSERARRRIQRATRPSNAPWLDIALTASRSRPWTIALTAR